MDKETILKNFSEYACSYDRNTDIQRETSRMLARLLPKKDVTKILEIGCGTGGYTAILKDAFGYAKIKAIDISGPMVKLARQKLPDEKISFEVGDAEEIPLGEEYDLITSNAVFHWLGALEGVIGKTERALARNGALLFSSLGPVTFSELRAALASVAGGKTPIASDFFPKKQHIVDLLAKYFKNINITERLIREPYPSIYELLKKIKYSGTRGRGSDIKKIWSPDLLDKIEAEYIRRFGSIEATYQVFFCEARR